MSEAYPLYTWLWVCLPIDRLCACRFTNSHNTVLHICSLFFTHFVLYFKHSLWYLTSFFSLSFVGIDLFYLLYFIISQRIFQHRENISLSEAYPLPDFEFVFLLTAFVLIVLPTLTTQFYTLLVRYFTLVLYFTIYLYAI